MKDNLWFKSDGGEEALNGFGQNLHGVSYPLLAPSIKHSQPEFLPSEVISA